MGSCSTWWLFYFCYWWPL